MGWDLDRLALLTEADTAYGQGAAGDGEADPALGSHILIRFPSRISEVRSAWEQNAKAAPDAESKVKVGARRSWPAGPRWT